MDAAPPLNNHKVTVNIPSTPWSEFFTDLTHPSHVMLTANSIWIETKNKYFAVLLASQIQFFLKTSNLAKTIIISITLVLHFVLIKSNYTVHDKLTLTEKEYANCKKLCLIQPDALHECIWLNETINSYTFILFSVILSLQGILHKNGCWLVGSFIK